MNRSLQGATRERNKGKHTHTHPTTQRARETRRPLRETLETVDRWENPSRRKHSDHKEEQAGRASRRDNPARCHTGVIERPWSAETQPRHCIIDVVERQRASEATRRADTTCVGGVTERLHAAETTPRRLCATCWSRRASQSRDTPKSTLAWNTLTARGGRRRSRKAEHHRGQPQPHWVRYTRRVG